MLKNFSISDYKDEEEVIHPCQVNSPLSKSTNDCNKTGAKKQMQELSCGLEFLLTQNPDNKVVPNSVSTSSTSLNSPSTGTSSSSPDRAILKFETDLAPVHRNPSYPAKKQKIRSEKERDSLHHSDAIHKPTNIRKLSGSKGSKTKESIHLNETTRTPDGAIEKSGELVSLPSILNSSTHRSSKQLNKLQHSFPFNNNSNNNNNNKRTLLPSNSNESLIGINGNRNCHNCSRYNSAQRFRQMILKARQESGNC
ncbi:unnamed protein product [Trichobilharzia regenti]|nr:unnamed protein product [Trichobilharzia regenti]